MQSVLLPLWNYVRNQSQKILENNPHISSTVWHLPREILGIAIERLNKVKRLKKKMEDDCREENNQEINIKMRC